MHQSRIHLSLAFALFSSFVLGSVSHADEERTFNVAVQTPATNYTVHIENIYQAGDEIWVLARVKKIGDIGGAAITTVKDKVTIKAPAGEVKTFIVGKSWNWEDPKSYKYVSDKEMQEMLDKQKKENALKKLFTRKSRAKKAK